MAGYDNNEMKRFHRASRHCGRTAHLKASDRDSQLFRSSKAMKPNKRSNLAFKPSEISENSNG